MYVLLPAEQPHHERLVTLPGHLDQNPPTVRRGRAASKATTSSPVLPSSTERVGDP